MTPAAVATAVAAAVVGAAGARGLLRLRLRRPPERLMRTNVSGKRVPAVIGAPLSIGGLLALALVAPAGVLDEIPAGTGRMSLADAIQIVLLWAAGAWDDLGGDERPRGFRGHLGAVRSLSLTGGIVKMVSGALAGIAAGLLVEQGWGSVRVALIVPLSANLINLLDRAPGRAAKAVLGMSAPLWVFGAPGWVVASGGLFGALAGCLPADLRERAMLGDAGANPLGAVAGLGLATAVSGAWGWAVVAVLAALNAASERWSFSEIIRRTRALRALDELGRK